MRHLNIAGIHEHLNVDEVAIELGNSCIYLESIDFWKSQTFTSHGLRALARCKNLREMDFGWWYVILYNIYLLLIFKFIEVYVLHFVKLKTDVK